MEITITRLHNTNKPTEDRIRTSLAHADRGIMTCSLGCCVYTVYLQIYYFYHSTIVFQSSSMCKFVLCGVEENEKCEMCNYYYCIKATCQLIKYTISPSLFFCSFMFVFFTDQEFPDTSLEEDS